MLILHPTLLSSGSVLLADLKKQRSNLQLFLTETHNGPDAKNLSFEDYLIMPVQVFFFFFLVLFILIWMLN